jgi:hypothetical protein
MKKFKSSRILSLIFVLFAYIIATAVGILSSVYFPIENLIYTFSSPEAVYSYMNGTNDVKLIVEGETCDMVIGGGDGEWKRTYVPKTEAGWKIDNSSINDQDIIFKIQANQVQTENTEPKPTKQIHIFQ